MDHKEKARHRSEIAAWLRAILADNPNLTPTGWSLKAKLTRATVGRALDDKHDHVLSVVTLYKLAKAVNAAPPLDLGEGSPGIPSPVTLSRILRGLMTRMTPNQEWTDEALMAMAQALRLAMIELADNPELAKDEQGAELLGRFAALHHKAP